MQPLGLPDGIPVWGEFREDRFDVQYRRTVKSVQPLDFQSQPLNGEQPTDGRGNSVGPSFSALGEDSGLRPVEISTRVSDAA